jgi:hypothetical protein
MKRTRQRGVSPVLASENNLTQKFVFIRCNPLKRLVGDAGIEPATR